MKFSNSPAIVKIAFLTLITVIIWISFDVYRALTIESSASVSEDILRELNPTLDVVTLNQLQNRVYVSDEQIPEINITPNIFGQIVNEPEPEVTEEEIITEEEPTDTEELEATESGQEE